MDSGLSSHSHTEKPDSQIRSTIAFAGTRGVPANYGGFETAVDEITRRIVRSGCRIEVFCRSQASHDMPGQDQGRNLVYVKGSHLSKLDTFVSSIQTGRHLWRHRRQYRYVFWFNNANLPGILMTWLARIPMAVNTDGLEWRRKKWSWPFKAYYYLATMVVTLLHSALISDSHAIQSFYRKRFGRKTSFIPYGTPSSPEPSEDRMIEILTGLNLTAGKYFLQITRIEPDNLPLKIAYGFHQAEMARRGYKLIVVGYKDATTYAQQLVAYDGRGGIRIKNAIYDQDVLYTLRRNCYCYVHGNSVGGTNPALLEAMATCPRIVAIDCEFSREVMGGSGLYFDPEAIADTLGASLSLEDQSEIMRHRIASAYRWPDVARSYLNLAEGRPADYLPSLAEAAPVRPTDSPVPA